MLAQHLTQHGSELCFSLFHRFMGKDYASLQEHFREIPQTQLVADTPEYHQAHDIGGILEVVDARAGALIKLSVAEATPKAPGIWCKPREGMLILRHESIVRSFY